MTEQATEAVSTSGALKPAPKTFRTILGEKLGMTQVFGRKDNRLFGVTVVKAGPCPVLQVKSAEGKDGYNAVKLGFGVRGEKNVPKAQLGQFKIAGSPVTKHVREVRTSDIKGFEVGQSVVLEGVFKVGDYIDAQAVSKGKGFAGVMKRHNFKGMPASHGASDKQRSPGSLASRRSLGRVLPGQRMAGRMGGVVESMLKIEIVKLDLEKNLIYLNGSVPGPIGGVVRISETVKTKKAWTEPLKSAIRKDKMGNIIKTPTKAVKK